MQLPSFIRDCRGKQLGLAGRGGHLALRVYPPFFFIQETLFYLGWDGMCVHAALRPPLVCLRMMADASTDLPFFIGAREVRFTSVFAIVGRVDFEVMSLRSNFTGGRMKFMLIPAMILSFFYE